MRKMEKLKTEAIIAYSNNNKSHADLQIDRVANSISEFGFTQPILVDEENVILAGHKRLAAAKRLGLPEVPCIRVANLSEAQKKAYRIVDNKTTEESPWDWISIRAELEDLALLNYSLDPFMEGFQFPEAEEDKARGEDDSFDGEIPVHTSIKIGDVISLNEHVVVCGDSTQVDATEAESADLIITDPPYGVSYVGKTKEALTIENDNLSPEELKIFWSKCLDRSLSQLRPGGGCYVACPSGPLFVVFAGELTTRCVLRQTLIWKKDSMVLGRSDYHYQHEPILYGWKPGAAHYFTSDRTKTSILEHSRPKRSEQHPTMKPISLWAELISNSSKKQDIVFDPFLGSGTTLIACDQLGRVCRGIELSPNYCQAIVERFKAYCEDSGKEFRCNINGAIYEG